MCTHPVAGTCVPVAVVQSSVLAQEAGRVVVQNLKM